MKRNNIDIPFLGSLNSCIFEVKRLGVGSFLLKWVESKVVFLGGGFFSFKQNNWDCALHKEAELLVVASGVVLCWQLAFVMLKSWFMSHETPRAAALTPPPLHLCCLFLFSTPPVECNDRPGVRSTPQQQQQQAPLGLRIYSRWRESVVWLRSVVEHKHED